jgi:dienelactone hydrolase
VVNERFITECGEGFGKPYVKVNRFPAGVNRIPHGAPLRLPCGTAEFLPQEIGMVRTINQTTHSEQRVSGGRRIELEFRMEQDAVPAILLLPDRQPPAPAALLLHGYSSRKEHMADGVGQALLQQGIASLAIDLPLHGTRHDPLQAQSLRNPLEIIKHWRAAIREAQLSIRYLSARREIDSARIAIAGYSLGSFLSVIVAAQEPTIRAIVLAAGGDLPANTPFAGLARTIVDPLRAVRKLEGRPLLLVHGRWDRTVLPEQAERLYATAREPKELRWWDAGHILPPAAIGDAALWLADALRDSAAGNGESRKTG